MNQELPYHNHPAMQMICAAILKDLRLETIGAVLVLIAGSVAFTFGYSKSILLLVLSWVLIYFGVKYTWRALKIQNVEESELIKLLIKKPEKIVWVYSVITNRMPFGLQFSQTGLMYFKMIDGDEISISLPNKEMKVVSRFLNRLLPHATFGYSEDKEKAFRKNPEILIRDFEK